VRGEEVGDVVVEEGQSRGAETERVGGEIDAAAGDRGVELRGAIGAVAEALEERLQISEHVEVHRCIGAQFLAQIEKARLAPELASGQKLKSVLLAAVQVCAGGWPFFLA
jgi:hypothetical protein